MAKKYIFQKNDRVQITSCCQSYGEVGTIIGIDYWCTYATVKLDNGRTRTYNTMSLVLYNEQNNIMNKGDNEMIIGNYRIAMVKFVKGTNTTKGYAFALFDDSVCVDDLVLCDTENEYNVAKVTEIISKDDYEGCNVTKEIVCEVDFTAFEQRKENRAKATKLKGEMDKKMKEMQELTLYEMMAEKSPELAEMLKQYKTLMN